jgi:regulator of protease activity HflC (stomatin/prohibitin superfamily)
MSGRGQSGGVNISGSIGAVGGDIVGRDKIDFRAPSSAELDEAFRQMDREIRDLPPDARGEAEAILRELKREAAKGIDANDGDVAKLLDALVGKVPAVAAAAVQAFAAPILGGIVGPVTSFVLDKLRGK